MNQYLTVAQIHPTLLKFVRPSAHSTYSPSAIDAWMACGYRKNAIINIPEETSKYAEEGTLAHSVCEALFAFKFYDFPFSAKLNMDLMKWEQNNPGATAEMMMHAEGYYDCLIYWLNNQAELGDILWFGLERGVPIFPEKKCFGTGDCIIVGTKASAVIDFKYGKGKKVAASSLQLKAYGAGIARHLIDAPIDYKVFSVVYQPRIEAHFLACSYSIPELNRFLGDIWTAILESEKPDLKPVEGNHCYWCPAARTKDPNLKCGAILDKPVKLAHENFAHFIAQTSAPVEKLGMYNPSRDEALMKIIALAPMLNQMAKDGMEEFKMRLEAGEAIPGARLVMKEGNRVYNATKPQDIADLIKSKFTGIEPWKVIPEDYKIKAITEIEKEYKIDLTSVCIKKVTKEVDILDDKMKTILGDMAAYGAMINNGEGQE